MGRCFAGAAIVGMMVSGVFAQPAGQEEPARDAQERVVVTRFAGLQGTMDKRSEEQAQPPVMGANRMVLVRFLIAQVRLREGEQETGTEAPKAPVKGTPEESPFDIERLNQELQEMPIDLRTSGRLGSPLTRLMKGRPVDIIHRGQLTTLDTQQAQMTIDQLEPEITGVHVTKSGTMNSLSMQRVGLNATFTPFVTDDGRISLLVDLNSAQLGPAEDGFVVAELPEGKTVRSRKPITMAIKTTIVVASGQVVALAEVNTRSAARRTEYLVLVSADLLEPK